jgi:hypothetical protein
MNFNGCGGNRLWPNLNTIMTSVWTELNKPQKIQSGFRAEILTRNLRIGRRNDNHSMAKSDNFISYGKETNIF